MPARSPIPRRRLGAAWPVAALAVLGALACSLGCAGAAQARRGDGGPAPAYRAFWTWWKGSNASSRLNAAIAEGADAAVVQELRAHIAAIHPDLDWDTGPSMGRTDHTLSLSSHGDFALRVLIERWLAAAPERDAYFTFFPAKQPWPGEPPPVVTEAGAFEMSKARFSLEVDRFRAQLAVVVHHPDFATAPAALARLWAVSGLIHLVGEANVLCRIGAIDLSPAAPADAVDGEALRAAVAQLDASLEDEPMRSGTFEREGQQVMVTLTAWVCPIENVHLDTLYRVHIPFKTKAGNGEPTEAELQALIPALLGVNDALAGSGLLIGLEAVGDHLEMFVMTTSEERSGAAMTQWREGLGDWEATVAESVDREWEFLERW